MKMMKKTLALALLLTLMTITAASAQLMQVTVDAYNPDYNHVGSNWVAEYAINDAVLYEDGMQIDLRRGDRLDFLSILIDIEKSPDYGYAYDSYRVATGDTRGFSYEQVVEVFEDGGRYSGYSTYWYVTYTFTPI